MNSNRNRNEDKRPQGHPEQDTGVPVPDADEIKANELDLRSNGENDWQDEMPAESERRSDRNSDTEDTEREEGGADDEPDGAFSDSDSARTGGR